MIPKVVQKSVFFFNAPKVHDGGPGSLWNYHHSKEHAILHRNTYPKKILTPKKIKNFAIEKNNLKFFENASKSDQFRLWSLLDASGKIRRRPCKKIRVWLVPRKQSGVGSSSSRILMYYWYLLTGQRWAPNSPGARRFSTRQISPLGPSSGLRHTLLSILYRQ